MPTEEELAQAAARHIVRAAVKQYVQYKLFALPPHGGKYDPLTLPRRSAPVGFSEQDVYTSRPGEHDRRPHFPGDKNVRITQLSETDGYVDILIGQSGMTETEALANAAAGDIGPAALQLRRRTPPYRVFLARELRRAQRDPAPLFIEHARVLDAFRRLGARHQEALHDLDQSHDGRLSTKATARKRGITEKQVRDLATAACDALAETLYALYDVRSAA